MSATTCIWYCPHCGKRQDGGARHYVIEHEETMNPLVYGLCDECIIKHHRWMEGEDDTHQGSGSCLDCTHYLGVKNDKTTLGFDEYYCDIPRGDDEPRRIMCKDGYRCSRHTYNGTGPVHGKVYKGAEGKTELKPCPCCGSTKIHVVAPDEGCYCWDCGLTMPNRSDWRDRWNRRAKE